MTRSSHCLSTDTHIPPTHMDHLIQQQLLATYFMESSRLPVRPSSSQSQAITLKEIGEETKKDLPRVGEDDDPPKKVRFASMT